MFLLVSFLGDEEFDVAVVVVLRLLFIVVVIY
jgi:hypothetical protein